MKIEENKQYDFNCKFTLPRNVEVNLLCSLFRFKENIVIVSFVDNQRFTKLVFNSNNNIIQFENYYQDYICFDDETINELIEIYNEKIKIGLLKKELNTDLIKQFNLEVENFSVMRSDIRFSFWDQEIRYKNENNDYLYKNVKFFSSYALNYRFDKRNSHLNLDLFKDKNTYWYCVSNSSGDAICKFVFSYDKEEVLFTLIQRENYLPDAELIDFSVIKEDFKNLTNTSEQMHFDIADNEIKYAPSFLFGYLYRIFKKEQSLPLSL